MSKQNKQDKGVRRLYLTHSFTLPGRARQLCVCRMMSTIRYSAVIYEFLRKKVCRNAQNCSVTSLLPCVGFCVRYAHERKAHKIFRMAQ